jgi:hypothetical protein
MTAERRPRVPEHCNYLSSADEDGEDRQQRQYEQATVHFEIRRLSGGGRQCDDPDNDLTHEKQPEISSSPAGILGLVLEPRPVQ